MATKRRRCDLELVARGLVTTRQRAAQLIESHQVLVDGVVVDKPSRLVASAEALVLLVSDHWVSRGSRKLLPALNELGIVVSKRSCLDVGSSTGGFVQVLLDQGAEEVAAVDVGTHQLDNSLVHDPRVRVYEQTDIRGFVNPFGARYDIITVDVSFISCTSILGDLVANLAPEGVIVVLIKPQFEVGRHEAHRGKGVVRDPELWYGALCRVVERASEVGLRMRSGTPSRVRGAKGNQEFFVSFGLDVRRDPQVQLRLRQMVDQVSE
ncbi:MAG: TlyA family RNA methyltransferase [Ferrimicrobium sp.]